MGEQIETMQVDIVGISSASPPVKSVPPRPRGMTFRLVMISQLIWIEVMTRLAILEAKVG